MTTMFGPEHDELLAHFRKRTGREAQREDLKDVVRIHDRAFLDRLITMDIGAEKALALRLIPLVFVAWADGAPDAREREAVLRAAGEQGLAALPVSRDILKGWLVKEPDTCLLERWKSEVQRVWNRFTTDEQLQMRHNLLGSARDVATAAGSFLGITSGISAREKAVLEELNRIVT